VGVGVGVDVGTGVGVRAGACIHTCMQCLHIWHWVCCLQPKIDALRCVCSILQYVAVCCSVLKYACSV